MNKFENVTTAIEHLKSGKMVILVDDESRENEGDLVFAAEFVTEELIAFMLRYTSGIICVPMQKERLAALDIPLMVSNENNTSRNQTKFTTSVEARHGVSTGVSAHDRATTIKALINPSSTTYDICKPGHVYPLEYTNGGILKRRGHTEGSIDLVKAAGLNPYSVICELMNEDGSMMKGKQITDFAKIHNIPIVSIEEIYQYRAFNEVLVQEEASANLPTEYGNFKISVFTSIFDNKEHMVLHNNLQKNSPTLIRIHSSCATGDIFHSLRCDCREQLEFALNEISKKGGMLIYLNQEGRGIGLTSKIKAYDLQERYNLNTIEANEKLGYPVDLREYLVATQIIKYYGINSVELLTNNPEKVQSLINGGIKEVKRAEMPSFTNDINQGYLNTKKNVLGHFIK